MRQQRRASAQGLRSQRGQTILEYLVMLGVVLLLIIAFAKGGFNNAINAVFNSSSTVTTGTQTSLTGVDLTKAKNW